MLRLAVKTLAIRGTAEERMVVRRNALKNSQEKLPKLIEEAGMRHYIAVRFFLTNSLLLKQPVFVLEPQIHHPDAYLDANRRLSISRPSSRMDTAIC
jgi:hypothetical protein